MCLRHLVIAIVASVFSPVSGLAADEVGAKKPFPIEYALRVSDERKHFLLLSLLASARALHPKSDLAWDFENETKDKATPDFVFVSEDNLIEKERLNPKALAFLPESWREHFTAAETNTDRCYVEEILPPSANQRTVIAFHNGGNPADPEEIYRCFTLALWFYFDPDYKDLDFDNWRSEVSKLLAAVG